MTTKGQSNAVAANAETQDTQTMTLVWTDKMLNNYIDVCIGEIYASNCRGKHISIRQCGKWL